MGGKEPHGLKNAWSRLAEPRVSAVTNELSGLGKGLDFSGLLCPPF